MDELSEGLGRKSNCERPRPWKVLITVANSSNGTEEVLTLG